MDQPETHLRAYMRALHWLFVLLVVALAAAWAAAPSGNAVVEPGRGVDVSAASSSDTAVWALSASARPLSRASAALAWLRGEDMIAITDSGATNDETAWAANDAARALVTNNSLPLDNAANLAPVELTTATGQLGGPSAGLALALVFTDQLLGGGLLGDLKIAATGTIDANGNVGDVGAFSQKRSSELASTADVVFVPAEEQGAGLVGVSTLAEAAAHICSMRTVTGRAVAFCQSR